MKYKYVLLILFLLVVSCTESEDSRSATANNYDISLEIRDEFEQPTNIFTQGELIIFNLSITNITGNGINIFTGDGCTGSYEIIDSEGVTLGHASIPCLATIPTETLLKPGDIFNESNLWDQYVTTSISPLPVGDYTIILSIQGIEKTAVEFISIT